MAESEKTYAPLADAAQEIARPRARGMRARDKRPLTDDLLIRWITLFHEKTGKWPTHKDATVWDKDANGAWHVVADENWPAINMAIHAGSRGLRSLKGLWLADFREQHGLGVSQISETRRLALKQIRIWVWDFYRKEGRRPTKQDKTVWGRDAAGQLCPVEGETWMAIHLALLRGGRGLPHRAPSSLPLFCEKHGLGLVAGRTRGPKPRPKFRKIAVSLGTADCV